MPFVSVIVPNYNHAPYLRQRIDSVLSQTFQDFELILLDDCSNDGSREIIESYRGNPHVSHVVYNEHNSGSAFHQWKKGIEIARGEWVWIAESDDWAEPAFLETMIQMVGQDPNCVLGSSIPGYVFPDGKTWHKEVDGKISLSQGRDFVLQRLVISNTLANVSALLMRRDILQQLDFTAIGRMRLCGDWLLYAMLCEKGAVAEYDGVLSYFRQHGDNTSAEAEKQGLSLLEGVEVLNYLLQTYKVPTQAYAKEWGRSWAKKERKYHYDQDLKKKIQQLMRNHPSIRLWHNIYQIRLWLK